MKLDDATRVLSRALSPAAILALLVLTGCAEGPTQEPERAQPAGVCGKTGQPDCPLQGWMKANLQAYLKAGDKERLASALEELARHEPKGYAGWTTSARTAAEAARKGDLAQVKTECRTCHDASRSRFRAEMRSVRLF